MSFVIDHNSSYYKAWKFFINIAAITSSFIYAYFAAFNTPNGYTGRRRMLYVEFLFLIDIFVKFNLSFNVPGSPTD